MFSIRLIQWFVDTICAPWGLFGHIHQELARTPTTERAIADARGIYRSVFAEEEWLTCVWSGRAISSPEAMHIDHILPFSVWKNNDLWSLLPTLGSVNAEKRDQIPDRSLLESRRECIVDYWDLLHDHTHCPFEREIGVSLLGTQRLRSG